MATAINTSHAVAPATTPPGLPLTPMQRGMLFHTLLAPRSGGYIEQMVVDLSEDLDVPRFQLAWQQALDRHPMLRAAFRWEGLAEPAQEIAPQAQLPWQVEDWSSLTAAEQESRFTTHLAGDRARGFILEIAPLVRGLLIRRGPGSWWFLLTSHHLLMDGRSRRVLLQQAFASYAAAARGELLTFPDFRPFTEYLEFLKRRDTVAEEGFWREALRGFEAPNVLRFQTTPGDPHRVTSATAEVPLRIGEELSTLLAAHAEAQGVTLNTVLQAAWGLLLQAYSGQEEVLFGVLRSCRRSGLPEGESTVGLFINTLPLRLTLSPDQTWGDLLRETRERWRAMRPFEHAPLERIQTWAGVAKGGSLFDSIFMFETYQLDEEMRSQGGEWESRRFRVLEQTNHPFTLSVYGGRQLLVKAEYDTARFSADSIHRLVGHYRQVLEQVVANPSARLREIPILTPGERALLLEGWRPRSIELPAVGGYLALWKESLAAAVPGTVAVEAADGSFTYEELERRSNQLAHHLRGLGVGPETCVGVCLERSRNLGVAFLAIWKAGGAYVPLDPAYPQERLGFMLRDAGVGIVITQDSLTATLPETEAIRRFRIDADWEGVARQSTAAPENRLTPESLAYIIYTSGSTGQPKGVQLTHQGLANHNLAVRGQFGLAPGDRILQICSLCFDVSVEEMFPAWIAGATVVPAPPGRVLPDASFTRFVEAQRLTVLDLATAFWHEWVNELERSRQPLPPSVRLVIVGGEKASPQAYAAWQRIAPRHVRWIDGYGPTEITVAATSHEPSPDTVPPGPSGGESIGRPFPNTYALVVDSWGRLAPVGVPGELLIGGAGVARGYVNRPDLTAEKFIPDPVQGRGAGRVYRSGDLVRWRPDGYLEFLGRIDHQVKIRGFRIELGEIETRLSRHPGVAQALVVDREVAPGDRRLVAYLVTRSAVAPSVTELKGFLVAELPQYMVPAAFVTLDGFPMTPNGKVDRKGLPAPVFDGTPLALTPAEQPKDELEGQLARIWEEVLGVRQVSRNDSFFDLGGHSLLAVRLFSTIRSRLGRNVPLAALFEAPTLAELAGWIRTHGESQGWSSLVPIQPHGTRPPLFCVHAAGGNVLFYRDLAKRLGQEQPFYGLQPRGLDGRLPYHNTIEEMAAHYIAEIRTVQPKGPYHIGGASYGGVVAWEIAQQLHRLGERVALLALFDTNGPGYPRLRPGVGKTRLKLARTFQQVQQHWGNLLLLPPGGRWEYIAHRLKKARLKLRRAHRRGWRQLTVQFHHLIGKPLPDSLKQTQHAIQKAYDAYQVKPYPGRLTLFRATHQPWGVLPDNELGWKPYAESGVEVVDVPGFHGTVVVEPCVRFLVAALTPFLERSAGR